MANRPTKKPEFLRKKLVTLKRKPQVIALLVLAAASGLAIFAALRFKKRNEDKEIRTT